MDPSPSRRPSCARRTSPTSHRSPGRSWTRFRRADPVRDRPAVVLTHHFFTSLFDFGFLSDDGAESLKRVLLGGLSLAIAGGLLLTRVFMAKYGELADAPAEVYLRAVVADHAFLMAVPMWI